MCLIQPDGLYIRNAQLIGINPQLTQRVIFGNDIIFAVTATGCDGFERCGPVIILLPVFQITDKRKGIVNKAINTD